MAKGLFEAGESCVEGFGFKLAFPEGDGVPPEVAELDAAVEVAFPVTLDFGLPEVGVCFWQHKVFAVLVSVPEAAVDEDGGSVFFEDNVGGARELFHVESVSETLGKQELAHKKFGLGVFASYALHTFTPLLGIELVCHSVKLENKSLPEYDVTPKSWTV